MYARVSSWKVDPARFQEMDAKLEEIRSILDDVPGLVHCYTARDEHGNGVTVALYESEQAAKAAEFAAKRAWSSVADVLSGEPQRNVYSTVYPLAGRV